MPHPVRRDAVPRWARWRILGAIGILGAVLMAVLARAYRLQIEQGADLAAMAEDQYLAQVRLPARRGTIVDRNGQVLAVSVDVDSIHANPREVGSRAKVVAAELSKILGLRATALEAKLRERRHFVWIERRVTDEEARLVRAAKWPGIYTVKESRRFYPNGDLAATALGFAGMDSVGLEGVERALDRQLRGSAEEAAAIRDAHGRELYPLGGPDPATRAGHDVRLTIDRQIQHFAETALREAVTAHRAQSGWIVVTDPKSGEVLALASSPTYDPNQPETAAPAARRNRAVTDLFEPGSTAKVFSIGAALEAGVVSESERFFCENGSYRVGGHTIRDTHPEGWLDLTSVMAKSSNVGTAKIASRLGRERLHATLERLGFGSRTGVELPGEPRGVLPPPARWSEIALANIAFGQGFSTTALQLAGALGAVANGGVWTTPHVVREVRDPRGAVARATPERRRALSPDTARRLTAILERVTRPGGTGVRAAVAGYGVAGKTGTAQKVDPVAGGYSDDKWIASFIGFVPASAPRLLAVVVIDEPQGDLHYGGLIAAPAFRALAEQSLKYLGVPPDAPTTANFLAAAPAAKAPSSIASALLEEAEPSPSRTDTPGHTAVPDFTGMSVPEAIEAARQAGVRPALEGTGRAVGQSPGPGPAADGARVRIQFEPPG